MKTFLLLILALAGVAQTTKADTIDYWHVYYNKTRIAAFNNYNRHDVIIKIAKIKSNDSITVKFYKDVGCDDCDTRLSIEDEKHQTVIVCKGKGIGLESPISFALKDLLAYKKRTGCNAFEIFYPDARMETGYVPKSIFRIKFE